MEQVCIAALDCNELQIAQKCYQELKKEFPESLRVRKYKAMLYEVEEHYDEAVKVLNNIIEHDATNSGAKKRKIAILKAQGKNADAIKELAEYLKTYVGFLYF